MYESPVAKNRSVTVSLSWTGTDFRNLVSIFTIFGETKLISSSKFVVAIRVNFLWGPLNSWHFISANKLLSLYADLFLYNSFCRQRLSVCFFLLDNMRYTDIKAALATCKTTSSHQEQWRLVDQSAPSFPNLNLGASRTPPNCYTVTLRQNAPGCTRPNRL
jgi:hypothetical protein